MNEWLANVSKEVFNNANGLFDKASNGITVHPHRESAFLVPNY